MRYLLFITVDPEGQPVDHDPSPWVEQWNTRGVRIEGMQLAEAREARSVRVHAGERLVSDGPFAETAEWIAGYDLISCTDLDAAVEVAASHPMATGGRIEIRPVAPDGYGAPTAASTSDGYEPGARFMALFHHDPGGPAAPSHAVAEWVRTGLAAQRLVAHVPLTPVDSATLVRVRDGELLVTDRTTPEAWVSSVAFVDGEWEDALGYVADAPQLGAGAELREFLR